ncbi:MAG: DNA-binding protein [Candidatus Methylomirabilota bacterium]|nr:helix-turn-helix domain-containing protein [Candidatus Methylomirabilis sp.]NJD67361.1 helix-turn-helix domain-containing protein [candidate division NC10 bacterium]PWB45897.1 MAG: DNA-binding protein [candidate division NC10 bacterium]
MNKCLLRVDEAATLLSVSRWTIYRWVQEGRLEATKVGKGSLRIFQTSVAELIEQNRIWDATLSEDRLNLPVR